MTQKREKIKTREEIKDELFAGVGSISLDSTSYLFIAAIVECIHGTNRYVKEAADLIKPTLERIESLRKELTTAERNLQATFKRLQDEWLQGE